MDVGPAVGGYDVVGRVDVDAPGGVFRARRLADGRDVALRPVPDDAVADLRTMVPGLVALDSPHVVTVHELLEQPGGSFLVVDWVDGATLVEVRSSGARLLVGQRLGVIRGMLTGLAAAHDQGLVHGRISLSNILLDSDSDGMARLIDFGLGDPIPAYLAPELDGGADGTGLGTAASDVFAVAAVLVHLLTDRTVGEQSRELLAIDASLRSVLVKALAPAPADRYPDARSLLDALDEAAARAYGTVWWTEAGIGSLVGPAVADLVPLAPAPAPVATGGSRSRRPHRARRAEPAADHADHADRADHLDRVDRAGDVGHGGPLDRVRATDPAGRGGQEGRPRRSFRVPRGVIAAVVGLLTVGAVVGGAAAVRVLSEDVPPDPVSLRTDLFCDEFTAGAEDAIGEDARTGFTSSGSSGASLGPSARASVSCFWGVESPSRVVTISVGEATDRDAASPERLASVLDGATQEYLAAQDAEFSSELATDCQELDELDYDTAYACFTPPIALEGRPVREGTGVIQYGVAARDQALVCGGSLTVGAGDDRSSYDALVEDVARLCGDVLPAVRRGG